MAGSDFRSKAEGRKPYIQVSTARSQDGAQYQIEVRLLLKALPAGALSDVIHITTNDPDIPILKVPLRARVIK